MPASAGCSLCVKVYLRLVAGKGLLVLDAFGLSGWSDDLLSVRNGPAVLG